MNTINQENAILLIIDIQEKLVKMLSSEEVKNSSLKIAKACDILEIPSFISEQYPKGLGETIPELKESLTCANYLEKTSFSVAHTFANKLLDLNINKKQVILFGIETHICVLQTAFDLLNMGYELFIVKEACGSRNEEDKQSALRRLIHAGAQIVTVEMALFELLKSSKHPNFKEVQSLIK